MRDANDGDLRFVRRLAEESAVYGIPYGRDIKNSAVQARARQGVRNLEPGSDLIFLVAYHEADQRPLGYLILQLREEEPSTGELQSMIYDLAVSPRYWGTGAVRELVLAACRRTAQEGLPYMVGEVSAHNERTYLQALRLGFELERLRIVMHCSEEGPIPMPGRATQEKAYEDSRRSRQRLEQGIGIPGRWAQVRRWRLGRPLTDC